MTPAEYDRLVRRTEWIFYGGWLIVAAITGAIIL